jgi:hypothetical protein
MSSDKGLDKEFMKATVGGDGVPRSSSCIAFISILPMNDIKIYSMSKHSVKPIQSCTVVAEIPI